MSIHTIIIRKLNTKDIHPAMLEHFHRYQETHHAWVPEEGAQPALRETYFVDEWDSQKKQQVIRHCLACVNADGCVTGVFQKDLLKGFSVIEEPVFGSHRQYRELSYLHVSRELRGQGIGRELFSFTCMCAREMHGQKLYIAAHPSKESQAFYKAMGCIPAQEINQEILKREPFDIQLEINLY